MNWFWWLVLFYVVAGLEVVVGLALSFHKARKREGITAEPWPSPLEWFLTWLTWPLAFYLMCRLIWRERRRRV